MVSPTQLCWRYHSLPLRQGIIVLHTMRQWQELNIDETMNYSVCILWAFWRLHCKKTRACFLSLTQGKIRLCSANHWAGYFSNLACDWLSIVWAYSEQETENGPWFDKSDKHNIRPDHQQLWYWQHWVHRSLSLIRNIPSTPSQWQ